MAERDIAIQDILGKRIRDAAGRPAGRIEEIIAEPRGSQVFVSEFHLGAYAALERFAGWSIGRRLLRFLGARRRNGGYRARWDQVDLSEPDHPRLRCSVAQLEKIE
jgi:hypothetical protein